MKEIFWFRGAWTARSPAVVRSADPALWMADTVFDAVRFFDGCAPDLDRHCERLITSAHIMGMSPEESAHQLETLAREAWRLLRTDVAVYVRLLLWRAGDCRPFHAGDTRFTLHAFELPMPSFPMIVGRSRFRRCLPTQAPTGAKAACLYPINGIALREAREAGYESAIVEDIDGNVAELISSNVFIVVGRTVRTPALNGCFLNGITRQRVIALLRNQGVEVVEATLSFEDILNADEVFSTGNLSKVLGIGQVGTRTYDMSNMTGRVRRAYFDWAASQPA